MKYPTGDVRASHLRSASLPRRRSAMASCTHLHIFIVSSSRPTRPRRARAPSPVHFPSRYRTTCAPSARRAPTRNIAPRPRMDPIPPADADETRMGGNTAWDELRDGWMHSVPRVALRLDAAFSFALERVFVVSNASRVGVLGNHACDASGDTSGDTSGDMTGDTSGDTSADVSLLAPSSSFPLSDDVDPRSVVAAVARPFVFSGMQMRGKISPNAAASTNVRRARARVVQRTEQSERLEFWRRDQGDGAWWFEKRARRRLDVVEGRGNARDACGARARDDGASRRRGESRGGGGHDEASDERLAGEFAREGTIVDGDEGVDAFGRVAVFRAHRAQFLDPGENLDGTVRGARGPCSGVHASRRKPLVASARRRRRACRARDASRSKGSDARPSDRRWSGGYPGARARTREAWEGAGKGQQTVVVTCCEDEPTARHGAHRIRDGETYLWVTNTPSTSRKSTFIASRNRARRCRARTIRSGTWRRGRDLRGERERRRRRQARARAFFAMKKCTRCTFSTSAVTSPQPRAEPRGGERAAIERNFTNAVETCGRSVRVARGRECHPGAPRDTPFLGEPDEPGEKYPPRGRWIAHRRAPAIESPKIGLSVFRARQVVGARRRRWGSRRSRGDVSSPSCSSRRR